MEKTPHTANDRTSQEVAMTYTYAVTDATGQINVTYFAHSEEEARARVEMDYPAANISLVG